MPYDASPPPGVQAGVGISVNGEFSQDNFVTKTTIPAFYYQDFDYQVKGSQDWMYPKNLFQWKLRFAPDKTGAWQYRITSTDSSGTSTSGVKTFTVVANPANHGFVKVAKNDSRYFEYEDGTYFPALGYNMNYDHINWDNPVQSNRANFQKMGQNGIQLIRHWFSQWGIWTSGDTTWASMRRGPDDAGVRVPYMGTNTILPPSVKSNADVAMQLQQYWQPCMALGAWKQSPAVKPNTKYKVFIRYLIPQALPSPVDVTKPYGLTAKIWDWLSNPDCAQAGQGQVVTNYGTQISPKDTSGNWQWQILQGTIDTSKLPTVNYGTDFLRRFYVVLENIDHSFPSSAAQVLIDRVEIREDLGDGLCAPGSGQGSDYDLSNGKCGVNIVSRADMDMLKNFDQKYSYSFDKILDLAKLNNVYLKMVGLEKNEYIQNHIDNSGKTILDNQVGCVQPDGRTACPGTQIDNLWFYGNDRSMTKVRWLQTAWWRYMQARWGYSTNIHSWELLNEGNPFNGHHYYQADEFGKYMHQFGVNSHLVTMSNWSELPEYTPPNNGFWGNPNYPNLDYVDIHQYMIKGFTTNVRTEKTAEEKYQMGASVNVMQPTDWYDSAAAVNRISQALSPKGIYGVGKPIMRGETGFVINNTDGWQNEIQNDTTGVWLHKYIWAGINSGGLIESYWYDTQHIYSSTNKDFRGEFGKYYNFIKDVPLSNGNYQEVSATASDANLRVFGQKDTINKRAHIWIDNKTNTWGNVINNISPTTVSSATITIPGMPAGTYPVSWIDTYTGIVIKTENVNSSAAQNLTLSLPQALSTDIAVKIGDYSTQPPPTIPPASTPTPSPSPSPIPGDIVVNGKVDIYDYNQLLTDFGKTGTGILGDINPPGAPDGKVDIYDYNLLLTNFGK